MIFNILFEVHVVLKQENKQTNSWWTLAIFTTIITTTTTKTTCSQIPISMMRQDMTYQARRPMPDAWCPMPDARCPMPYALCPMPYSLCPMPYALCPVPCALCPVPYQYTIFVATWHHEPLKIPMICHRTSRLWPLQL